MFRLSTVSNENQLKVSNCDINITTERIMIRAVKNTPTDVLLFITSIEFERRDIVSKVGKLYWVE
jgi:hypothetical protein